MSASKWVGSLPKPNGVLEDIQRRGRLSLIENGLPRRSMEAWRLTDLDRLKCLFQLPLAGSKKRQGEHVAVLEQVVQETLPEACRLDLNPGCDPLKSIALPSQFIPLTNTELQEVLGRILRKCDCNSEWPVEVNQASANQVLALHVKGEAPPLELIMQADSDELSSTRVVLILEENAQLDLLQIILGSGNSAQSHVLEIYLGEEASLKHELVALGGGNANLMAHVAIEQDTRSDYSLTTINHGWSLGRLEPRVVQAQGNASTAIKGLQIASKFEQTATHSYVRFDGPQGSLDQLNKAVASGRAHSIFNGAIAVPRKAQETNAAQLSRNLLLSTQACIDTKPELEIVADDVRCTHGATISQLQQEELFYIRSRGININQAMKLLLEGYCNEIVDNLSPDINRLNLLEYLLSKIHA